MAELRFHPAVAKEIQEAYSWYEAQAVGLGEDFINELELAYESIRQMPESWPKFSKRTRRFLLTRFPYAIVYKPSTSICYIAAVMHQSRKPGYWRDRI